MLATILTVLLLINALMLIAVIVLQAGKSAGLSGAITGGAEQLFGRQKARGIDGLLHNLTRILAVTFMLLAMAVAYLGK
ncbi:preprotein translocase subunit SecG [Hydrogenibacillus schlegelii]|uniref:Protein-export membrane protein SecG n=1 Tax=Hydrogenibacillus schlegelii TaxID=1484 RepID=A0A132NAQ6_HYDSH|nr:preprotein translocase subunit SecG [Hydrogenibacillus schlegelii]OAR03540.1 preprotein translocase subunit SecG [Hydrogenibacillus schlegelii]PTQ54271.1 MAG: Preprotein translocase subunit SecG [Hydrogenibacillus schlegelii]